MSIYSDVGLTTSTAKTTATTTNTSTSNNSTLSQEDFLSLLTTQLAYQDPTKPVDNAEMVSQMAQISTVSSLSSLNSTVNDLSSVVTSSQALMASSLVGQKVLLPSSTGYLTSGGSMTVAIACRVCPAVGLYVVELTVMLDFLSPDWPGSGRLSIGPTTASRLVLEGCVLSGPKVTVAAMWLRVPGS